MWNTKPVRVITVQLAFEDGEADAEITDSLNELFGTTATEDGFLLDWCYREIVRRDVLVDASGHMEEGAAFDLEA